MSPFVGLELGNYPQWRNSSFSMNPAVLGDFLDLCNNLKVMILFWIDNRNNIEAIRQKAVKEFSDKSIADHSWRVVYAYVNCLCNRL